MEIASGSYLDLIKRWWWLLLVGAVVGGAVGYYMSSREEPMYSSSVLLQVNPPQAEDTFNVDTIEASQTMAVTYRQMVWNREVLDPVISMVWVPYDIDELRGNIFAWTITGTQIIEITVEDIDPIRAAALANAVGESLVRYVESGNQASIQPARTAVDEQLVTLEAQIGGVEAEIVEIQQGIGEEGDVAAEERVSQLRARLEGLNEVHTQVLATQQEMELRMASSLTPLEITTPAEPSINPENPSPRLATILGSGFGFFVGAGVLVALGYLDKTVRKSTDFTAMVGAPLIGCVGREPTARDGKHPLFVAQEPHAAASEELRALRANIGLRFLARGKKNLVISSPHEDKGKSQLVANLALASAQAGLRTVLIDAGFRNASQHRLFGIANDIGLSTWLHSPGGFYRSGHKWTKVSSETVTPNLRVIPSGPIDNTPSDLLVSTGQLGSLLAAIGDDADFVIVDAPPVLAANETTLLTADAEGIILVCRTAVTHQGMLLQSLETLAPTGTELSGVVLSEVSGRYKPTSFALRSEKPLMKAPQYSIQAGELPKPRPAINSAD